MTGLIISSKKETLCGLEGQTTCGYCSCSVGHGFVNDESYADTPTGGPGVGKGTQCARIARDFGAEHISVGDLLREEAESDSSVFAEFINDSIRNSVIMPAELTINLLRNSIDNARSKGKCTFIIDGFPRSLEQARAFEEKVINPSYKPA
jgi:hypothetical protein